MEDLMKGAEKIVLLDDNFFKINNDDSFMSIEGQTNEYLSFLEKGKEGYNKFEEKTNGSSILTTKSENNTSIESKIIFQKNKNPATRAKVEESNINETSRVNYSIKRVLKKNKNNIFNIVKKLKTNKRRGRLPNHLKKYYHVEHSKDGEDNIIIKIKRSFLNKLRKFLNQKYEKYLSEQNKKNELLLKGISPKQIIRNKKEKNSEFFKKTLKSLFSETEISSKYTKNGLENYNKAQIDKLYKKNKAKNIIKILDMKVEDIYYIFSHNLKEKGFEELRNLEYDLKIRKKELYSKNENEEYIRNYLASYKYIAENLIKIIDEKKARNSSKNL